MRARSPLSLRVALVCGLLACAGPADRVRHDGGRRWLDLGGGVELELDPTSDLRRLRVEEEDGGVLHLQVREVWSQRVAPIINARSLAIDGATAASIAAGPHRIARLISVLGTLEPAAEPPAFTARAWEAEDVLSGGLRHEQVRGGGLSTYIDPPRYLWTLAFTHAGSLVVLYYMVPLPDGDSSWTPEQILARARARHLSRLRRTASRLRAPAAR